MGMKVINKNLVLGDNVEEKAFYLDAFIVPSYPIKHTKKQVIKAIVLPKDECPYGYYYLKMSLVGLDKSFRDEDGGVTLVELWVLQNKYHRGEEEMDDIDLGSLEGQGSLIHSKDGKRTLDELLIKVFPYEVLEYEGEKVNLVRFPLRLPKVWLDEVEEGNYIHLQIDADDGDEYKDIYVRCSQKGRRYDRGKPFDEYLKSLRVSVQTMEIDEKILASNKKYSI